jgi:hypothetical protein
VRVRDPAAAATALAGHALTIDGDRVLVTVDDPDARTPGIVRALVGAGVDVLEAKDASGTLEEAYLRLVREAP